MAVSIITQEDLNEFKDELIESIKVIIEHQKGKTSKKWLKSQEVRELLGISTGTLQNLRINGTLPYTKIGGVIYYDFDKIINILEENTVNTTQ